MSASPLARLGLTSQDEGPTEERGNRKAVLGIAAVATAGLVAVAVLLLGSGSDELDSLDAGPAAAAAAGVAGPAAPEAGASPVPTPSLRFPDAAEVRDGRDPFAALLVDTADTGRGAAGGTPAAAAPVTPDVPGVEGAAPVAAAPRSAVGAPGTDGPEPGAPTVSSMALLRVEGTAQARAAVFTVDGAEQRVEVGESFGTSGSLLLLSLQEGPGAGQWTAVVQVGQGDPFDVVTGSVVPVPAD